MDITVPLSDSQEIVHKAKLVDRVPTGSEGDLCKIGFLK